MGNEKELVKVEYIIPASVQVELTDKITEAVKSSYWSNVGTAVSEKVKAALESEGLTDRIARAVVEKIKMSEDDFVNGLTENVKEAILKTTGVITKEVLNKIQERIQSYGFIKIADKY